MEQPVTSHISGGGGGGFGGDWAKEGRFEDGNFCHNQLFLRMKNMTLFEALNDASFKG